MFELLGIKRQDISQFSNIPDSIKLDTSVRVCLDLKRETFLLRTLTALVIILNKYKIAMFMVTFM